MRGSLFLLFFPGFAFFILTFWYRAERTGLITRATSREELKAIIKVMGRNLINCPIICCQKSRGTNAPRVVRVEVITGQATSSVAAAAASERDLPSWICRYMFSTITMALSTSMPNDSIKAKRTTIFRDTSMAVSKPKVRSIE